MAHVTVSYESRPRLTIMAHSWLFIHDHSWHHNFSSVIIHEQWASCHDHGRILDMPDPLTTDGKPWPVNLGNPDNLSHLRTTWVPIRKPNWIKDREKISSRVCASSKMLKGEKSFNFQMTNIKCFKHQEGELDNLCVVPLSQTFRVECIVNRFIKCGQISDHCLEVGDILELTFG